MQNTYAKSFVFKILFSLIAPIFLTNTINIIPMTYYLLSTKGRLHGRQAQ